MSDNKKMPSFGFAVFVLTLIVAVMSIGMIVFKASLQTMMFLSWLIVIPATMKIGYKFNEVENFAYDMMRKVMQPSMILLAVGAMIGAWIMSGTVPAMIYYGLKIITPQFFLVTTLLLCAIVSVFTGTSWGTIGTAGLAMIGIGTSMGIPAGMTAGAIICGAYFGDKMSPISDSTNLAPAIAGAKVMNHVKHMLWTTGPSFLITAVISTVLGLKYSASQVDYNAVNQVSDKLAEIFNLGIIPLLPALLVFYLLFKNKPPVPSILIGAVTGALVGIFYQGATLKTALATLYTGYVSKTDVVFIDKLLSRGGISSMYGVVGLFLFALGLGGMLNGTGILTAILNSFSSRIKSVRSLVICTMLVSYVSNMVGATISFAAVMTGTLMQPLFKQMRLRPENLSRIIEDCGTLGGPIIPWNTGAVYSAGVLGVSPYEFIPYCFLSFINPIVSLIYGVTGFSMTMLDEGEEYGETEVYKYTPQKTKAKSNSASA